MLQAPTGSNMQGWSVVVVTDADKKKAIGEVYREGMALYAQIRETMPSGFSEADLRTQQMPRILDSALYLGEHLQEAPALVLFCLEGRVEAAGAAAQASVYGSILPAAWSFICSRAAVRAGWAKTIGGLRRTRYRGVQRTHHWAYMVGAAYNLVRMTRLLPAARPT